MTKQTKTAQTAPAQTASAATPKVTEKVAKAPKTPKTASAEVAAAAPVAVASAAAAPAVVAEPKAKKAKKEAAAPKVAAPVVASTTTENVVVSIEAVAVESATISTEFSSFATKLQQLSAVISSLKTEFRSLERKASRELKTAAKASHKRKRKTGNRSPSGFVKPTLISDELAAFLGKSTGTEMARTEVTREINNYIRANSLQDKANGRRINADTKLSSLLKLASGEELTYFNLQRYMSPHFAKSSAVVAAAVATA